MPDYRAIAREKAEKYGYYPDLFELQIERESNFDPNAYNPSGASGIAQIMPQYHDVDVWNPVESLDYAAKWMSELVRTFGSVKKALAAYNWGPGRVKGWDGQRSTLPAETRHYLDYILGPDWYDPTETHLTGKYVFPVVGYGGRVNNHWGTAERGGSDIFGNRGDRVVVTHGGVVTYAGYDDLGGNNVVIHGNDDLDYYYAHLDAYPNARAGQRVTTGHYLGPLGDTGNAKGTGPHLHIGIGYGINNGSGPAGGCGRNFDAVGLLQGILDGTVVIEDEDEMARIAELEALLAQSEAELAETRQQLTDANSWIGATTENVLKPLVEEATSVLESDPLKAELNDMLTKMRDTIQTQIGE